MYGTPSGQMTPEDIGRSVLIALVVVVVLAVLWPYLPKSGTFSGLTVSLSATAKFVVPALVIGAPVVACQLVKNR